MPVDGRVGGRADEQVGWRVSSHTITLAGELTGSRLRREHRRFRR